MEFPVITLPVMHLVCNVVMSPNSSVLDYSNLALNQTAPVITLPVMRLACNIIVSPNSTVPENINLAVNRWSDQFQSSTLPSDYIVYPEINAAYKISDEQVTWTEARTRCARDNAVLAEIDSEVKMQLVLKQKSLTTHRHVGIYRKDEGSSTFYSVKTGLAVASLPWEASEPRGDSYLCVMTSSPSNARLIVNSCGGAAGDYVCELPIPEHLKQSK